MLTNGVFDVFRGDIIEMALESVHESPLGLSHVLYLAGFAGDTIDKVSALTVYPGFG